METILKSISNMNELLLVVITKLSEIGIYLKSSIKSIELKITEAPAELRLYKLLLSEK